MTPDADQEPTFSRAKFEEVTQGDPALRQQLLRMFLGQAAATRQRVVAAAQAGREAFADAIHRLKSTSHYVGGMRLYARLQHAEASPELDHEGVRLATARVVGALIDELECELLAELERGCSRAAEPSP